MFPCANIKKRIKYIALTQKVALFFPALYPGDLSSKNFEYPSTFSIPFSTLSH